MTNDSTKKCGRPTGWRKPDNPDPFTVFLRNKWRNDRENWKLKKNPNGNY